MTATTETNGRPDLASKFGADGELAEQLNAAAGPERTLGTALDFDFTVPAAEPDYLVQGLYPRGTSNLTSAGKSSGKSFALLDLSIVVATGGGHWLGREVRGGKVLYIDEENPTWRVEQRWKALARVRGFGDEQHKRNLRYLLKQGVRLDDHEARVLDGLEAEIDRKGPGLTVIDTTTSATSADLNSNREAANVARELRAIADRQGEVIVTLHHHRKPLQGVSRDDPDVAAMGAAAWTNQMDGHSTWTWKERTEEDYQHREGDPFEEPEGRWRLRTAFEWVPDHTMRDGGGPTKERVVFESVKNGRGRLLWVTTATEGRIERASKEDDYARRAARIVHEAGREQRTAEIMEALGVATGADTPGTAGRGLALAVERGWLTKVKKGVYSPGESWKPSERPDGAPES